MTAIAPFSIALRDRATSSRTDPVGSVFGPEPIKTITFPLGSMLA
jgi:hypothetical protein